MRLSPTAFIALALPLCTGCSGWNISLSDYRNPHFRTLATLSPEENDKQALAFEVRKRDQSIMAEKTFYQNGDFSASLTGGRHREHRWMTGVSLDYSF